MNRRELFQRLATLVVALLFPWYRSTQPVRNAWPFVPVEWWIPAPCGNESCADQMSCPYAFRLVSCDLCYESASDDFGNQKQARTFYRTTDGGGLIVCEHCTAEYLDPEACA